DMGGGEYERQISQPTDAKIYRVGPKSDLREIGDALKRWRDEDPVNAVIEITESGVYTENIRIKLKEGRSLQLRAANRARVVLRLLNREVSQSDALSITGEKRSWFILDGVIVIGRGIQIEGDVSGVAIRHSTLVPGWGLECNCSPKRPAEPSIELIDAP